MTSSGKTRKQGRPKASRPKSLPDGGGNARRKARYELLYVIGKELARTRDPEHIITKVLSIAASALSLRSAVIALRTDGTTRLIAWPATRDTDIQAASNHALAIFAYLLKEPALASRGVEIRRGAIIQNGELRQSSAPGARLFVVLPLVVGRQPLLGALQVESTAPLDAEDLSFLDTVVTELAAALDRQREVERRIAEVESHRMAAEAVATGARRREAIASESEVRSRGERDLARSVAHSLGEGVVAVGIDATITLLNPAAEGLLGWKENEALGRPFSEVVPVRDANGAPIASDSAPVADPLRTGREVREDRHLFLDRGGTAFPVRYTSSAVTVDDAIAGAVVAFENLSALRRAEHEQRLLADLGEALGASLELPETLAAVCRTLVPRFADVAFVDIARAGGRVERSPVAVVDTAREALADRLRAQAPGPGSPAPEAQVLATGKPVLVAGVEAWLAGAPDGDHRAKLRDPGVTSRVIVPLSVHGRVFGALTCGTIGSGRLYGLADLSFAQDLARRAALALENARLYEASQAAIRAREEVLAVVSHDLRSPLSGIALGGQGLLRAMAKGDLPVMRRASEAIVRAAHRMSAQVERLLDFSRLESGQLALEIHENDLAALLAEAVASVEPVAVEHDVGLRVESDPNLPAVPCDADRIHQVMGNLLGNALKFTPRGGTVVARARREEHAVRLSVTDSGPGIPEADRERIFQAFWQATPGGRSGAGLGLAIARGIVEAHGGRISVESEVGAGSTFVVVLPVP
jgi:PAS domain S-box-containing protein